MTEDGNTVAAIRLYLALWPVAPSGAADTNLGVQTYNVSGPSIATENYVIARLGQTFSVKDVLDGTYYPESRPPLRGRHAATNSHTIPSYTVNGYPVATAGFQQIASLSNCLPEHTRARSRDPEAESIASNAALREPGTTSVSRRLSRSGWS